MRILFVTGKHLYGNPKRGEGYEIQNFTPALRRLGHEIEVFDNMDRSLYSNYIELNRALLEKVESWRPELILFIQFQFEIWSETWDIIRKSGIAATINWAADDSWKYKQTSRFTAKHFDAFVTTYADKVEEYRKDGHTRVLVSQWAADATQLLPPLPAAECEYEVSFIGTNYGLRGAYAKALQDAGVKVECFGHGWPNGPIAADRILPTIRGSVVTLNFSGSGLFWEKFLPNQRQIKARTFEVPGSGGFLLGEWAPGTESVYDLKTEIDTFRTEKELIEKAKFYLANPAIRDARAIASFERTVNCHTYDLRMKEVVDFAMAQHATMPAGTGSIDWPAFERAAAKHTVTPSLLRLRHFLIGLCGLAWKGPRGARAARKMLFEFSWRFMGAKTYSAEGLPGRLFYLES